MCFLEKTMVCIHVSHIRKDSTFFPTGRATVSFQLFEMPSQTPTNEQVIHHLRHLIDKQTLNLLDPNRCVLNTIVGSVVVGRAYIDIKTMCILFSILLVSVS